MPQQIPSKFNKFVLDEKDQAQAEIFLPLNVMHLHNLRTALAEDMLQIKFDPANPLEFAQSQAYIQGKIDILTEVLKD